MARILARALNAPLTVSDCPPPTDPEDYPEEDVQQRMADAVMRGEDLNVIEIDGASNNSVDQARQLINNAGLSPTGNARYKIYIIDEVHMLSNAAFNALLKTMEEPPPHVKFILCTTEAHKVPATIQSRCQKFDFRNIATARIVDHLRHIVESEKLKADDQVLWQVARMGNGSMRDALTLMDRLMSAIDAGDAITGDLVEQMLGLPPYELMTALINAVAAGDVGGSLEAASALLDRGVSQDQLIDTLIERFRQLMLLCACGPDSPLVELADDAMELAKQQATQFDAAGLSYIIALCENLQRHSKSSASPRALMDVAIVRLALSENLADVSALLAGRGGKKKK